MNYAPHAPTLRQPQQVRTLQPAEGRQLPSRGAKNLPPEFCQNSGESLPHAPKHPQKSPVSVEETIDPAAPAPQGAGAAGSSPQARHYSTRYHLSARCLFSVPKQQFHRLTEHPLTVKRNSMRFSSFLPLITPSIPHLINPNSHQKSTDSSPVHDQFVQKIC